MAQQSRTTGILRARSTGRRIGEVSRPRNWHGWRREVRRHDAQHPLHLNPHALVSNLAALSDNLPEWRGFLDTLGCSIHPAWHFGLLPRDDFALGVSYVNDLVDGAITPKPHWVTELQVATTFTAVRVPWNRPRTILRSGSGPA